MELLGRRWNLALAGPHGTAVPVDVNGPEVYWRVASLQVWYNAIEARNPASRDYADWLGPYLREGCFRDDSYPSFWLGKWRVKRCPSIGWSAWSNSTNFKQRSPTAMPQTSCTQAIG